MAENNQQGFNELCVGCADHWVRFGNRPCPVTTLAPSWTPACAGVTVCERRRDTVFALTQE